MRLNDTKLVYLCIKGYTSIFGLLALLLSIFPPQIYIIY